VVSETVEDSTPVADPVPEPDNQAQEDVQIPLRFNIPSGMTSRYAHHMLVQPGEHEVTLSFFEIFPPLLLGSPEEQKEILKKEGVKAECVARVTIAKARYFGFVKAWESIIEQLSATNAVAGADEPPAKGDKKDS
jgi:hypothetical protein